MVTSTPCMFMSVIGGATSPALNFSAGVAAIHATTKTPTKTPIPVNILFFICIAPLSIFEWANSNFRILFRSNPKGPKIRVFPQPGILKQETQCSASFCLELNATCRSGFADGRRIKRDVRDTCPRAAGHGWPACGFSPICRPEGRPTVRTGNVPSIAKHYTSATPRGYTRGSRLYQTCACL